MLGSNLKRDKPLEADAKITTYAFLLGFGLAITQFTGGRRESKSRWGKVASFVDS